MIERLRLEWLLISSPCERMKCVGYNIFEGYFFLNTFGAYNQSKLVAIVEITEIIAMHNN